LAPWIENCSRDWAEVFFPKRDTVIVSIWTPGGFPARLQPGYDAVCRVCFTDMDSEKGHPWRLSDQTDAQYAESQRKYVSFMIQPAQARTISRFVTAHRGKNIVVHCDAGISRSRAVVEAVLAAFPEYEDTTYPGHRFPNGRVKSLMKRALGVVPIGA
jgi:hypothetical protein